MIVYPRRIIALAALTALACSSSSKTVAQESCSPGELTPCELASGCVARKSCNPDGKTYGQCQCIFDAGSGGGSSGNSGSGGSGSSGSAGSAGTGSSGMGGSATGGTDGSAGAPGGSAGTGGTGATGGSGGASGSGGTGSSAGSGGSGGTGASAGSGGSSAGTAGSGGTGSCLKCADAVLNRLSPNDPRICTATLQPYKDFLACFCRPGVNCNQQCADYCADPDSVPVSQACMSCGASFCGAEFSVCSAH